MTDLTEAILTEAGRMRGLEAGSNRVREDYATVVIPPPTGEWTYDFTDDPDGAPAGWSLIRGLDSVVISGMYRCNVDWYFSQVRMDTPTLTTLGRKITVEFQWSVLTEEITIGIINAAGNALNATTLGGGGSWYCVRAEGYDGPSGTYTPPPINTPFTVEWTWITGGYTICKVNGTTIGTGNFSAGIDPTASIYVTIQTGGNIGIRKVKYEQPVYSDDFDRANSTAIASGGVGLGPLWDPITDHFRITGNKATQSDTMSADWLAILSPVLGPDMWAEADVDMTSLISGQRCSLVVRRDDFFNWRYIGYMHWDGTMAIAFNGGGTFEIIAQGGSHGSATTGKLRLEIQGYTLKLYYNGVLAVTGTDANTHSNFGKWAGMEQYWSTTSMAMDNFRCGPLPYLAPP